MEASTQAPHDTVLRIFTSRGNISAVASEAAKRLRTVHRDLASRTQTIGLSGAPSTQLVLGTGFECMTILLPGISCVFFKPFIILIIIQVSL